MKNKIIIGLLSLVILVSISLSIYFLVRDKNDKNNELEINGMDVLNDKDILKDTFYGDLSITNQVLFTQNGISNYSALVSNNSDIGLIYVDDMYIIFELEDETFSSLALHDVKFESGKSLDISVSFDRDISKVKKISFSNKSEEVK